MDKQDLDNLFSVIRESVSSKTWSKAVEISRQGNVFKDSQRSRASEIICQIKELTHRVSHLATLWPKEEDWHCDCASQEDPCLHVTAAVIALRKANENGQSLPNFVREVGQIGYSLKREQGFLSFYRVILLNGKSLPLTTSLSALVNGRIKGPEISPTKYDLSIDVCLTDKKEGIFPSHLWAKIVHYLSECPQIWVDDKPVTCSQESTGLEAWIEDYGSGVRLFGRESLEITEIFKNGVALCTSILKPVRQPKLTPSELEMLASGKLFGQKEMIDLVSQTIPQLSKKIPIINQAQKMAKHTIAKPRIILESSYYGETLIYKGVLVYGDPEIARLSADRLICHHKDLIPQRDIEQERQLQSEFSKKFQVSLGEDILVAGEDAVALTRSLQKDTKWALKLEGKGFSQFELYSTLSPHISVNFSDNGFDFGIEFSTQTTTKPLLASPARVMEAYQKGQSVVPLIEGGWAQLPQDWLKKHGQKLADLLSARDSNNEKIPNYLSSDLKSFIEGLDDSQHEAILNSLEKKLPTLLSDMAIEPIWGCVDANLRTYQKEGIRWLASLKANQLGALLADDMGLGKTLQTICILEKRSLIIAPTSVLYNWVKEINRFRPNLTVSIFHGSQRQFDRDSDVVITSYALLRLDQELLNTEDWDVLVLDESQTIKNPDSQVARAAYTLNAKFRVSLSGTPVENSLVDVWSQFHFLCRGLLGSYKDFNDRYVRPILNGSSEISAHLRKRLEPFIKRRLKSQVAAELPARSDVILYVDLSEEERAVYDAVQLASKSAVIEKLQAGSGIMQALELLLRLRQAACHPALIPGQTLGQSSKLDLLVGELEKSVASGHKALVFSQWTSFLNLVEKPLLQSGIIFERIDGSTTNRAAIVEDFQKGERIKVLLLSLKAAGVGLNLTAADHVFILDPWWNPAVENQAADRTHRIGQQNPVLVHKLVARETVEEKIILLQEHKKRLAEAILEGGDVSEQLSCSELINLLS